MKRLVSLILCLCLSCVCLSTATPSLAQDLGGGTTAGGGYVSYEDAILARRALVAELIEQADLMSAYQFKRTQHLLAWRELSVSGTDEQRNLADTWKWRFDAITGAWNVLMRDWVLCMTLATDYSHSGDRCIEDGDFSGALSRYNSALLLMVYGRDDSIEASVILDRSRRDWAANVGPNLILP